MTNKMIVMYTSEIFKWLHGDIMYTL